jgi:hypothetical protein
MSARLTRQNPAAYAFGMLRRAVIVMLVTLGCAAESDPGSTTAEECAAATTCAVFGSCGLVDGECAPTTEAHCRNAENACQSEGRCTLEGTSCVATTDADCKASSNCKALGHCSLFEDVCGAVTVADCKNSDRCRLFMQCEPKLGECDNSGHGH